LDLRGQAVRGPARKIEAVGGRAAKLWKSLRSLRWERLAVRLATVVLFVAAIAVAIGISMPEGDYPAVALGQEAVYRVEILLALIYGGLLLLTPFFYGAMRGRLPIEISHRGAKWAVEAEEALDKAEKTIASLEAERAQLVAERVKLGLQPSSGKSAASLDVQAGDGN
jgi:hypothetical protein